MANSGRYANEVLYYASVRGGTVFLTANGIVFDLAVSKEARQQFKFNPIGLQEENGKQQRLAFRLNIDNASGCSSVCSMEETEGRVNYLIGNDPAKWQQNIPTYKAILYRDIYPQVDLKLYGKEGLLTYDFIVHPGGNPQDIKLSMEGIDGLALSGNDMVMQTALGQVRQQDLRIYQDFGAACQEIEGSFNLHDGYSYGFEVAAYDPRSDLIIDPSLSYSTYLGGAGEDAAVSIVVDLTGNVYVAGHTVSNPFPTTLGAYSTAFQGVCDVFVCKINSTGTALIYSTYIGGTLEDRGNAVSVDASGNAYIVGISRSANFPTTAGVFQPACTGDSRDCFVTKLSDNGSSLIYSSYLGGNDGNGEEAFDVAVDSTGCAYVVGGTGSNFPTTVGAFDRIYNGGYGGAYNGFVTKVNAAGTAMDYSTYLSGNYYAVLYAVEVDADGCAYVAGFDDQNYPTTPGAYQVAHSGHFGAVYEDGIVTKLNAAGSALVYSTYIGASTSNDIIQDIALDASGNVYVAGQTINWNAAAHFPTTGGAYQTVEGGINDIFITKFNPSLSALTYSTFIGGTGEDIMDYARMALDSSGCVTVTGYTTGNFPVTADAYQGAYGTGATDAILTKMNAAGTSLVYSTYLGGTANEHGTGIDVSQTDNIHLVGWTRSNPFPTTPGVIDTSYNGSYDAFICKFQMIDPPTVTSFSPPTGKAGDNISITGTNFIGATAVTFGGTAAASYIVDDATQIRATTGNGTTGTISVTGPGGTGNSAGNFTFIPAPNVTNCTPAQGAQGQAVTVYLTGTNFTGATNINFGEGITVTNFIVNSATQITATINIAANATTGAHNISVTNPGGTSTLVNGFTVVAQHNAPQVSGTSNSGSSGSTSNSVTSNPVAIPSIKVQNASLSSQRSTSGEQITVNAVVANTGTVNAQTKVKLYINGQLSGEQGVNVETGKKAIVSFTVSRNEPGLYHVYVNSTPAGSFTVEMVPVADLVLYTSILLILSSAILGIIYLIRRRVY